MVSLSGISARALDRCADLSAELDQRKVPLSLLVAARLPGTVDPDAVSWIRQRVGKRDALLLHGFDHSVEPRPRALGLRRRAEFAGLPAHEAELRLTAATVVLERIGLATDLFAPPRWLASPGTLKALRRKGFALCADLAAVRDLRRGTVHKGRVQGIGHGDRTEPWWCYALVLGAARSARRGGLVRLAAGAGDLARPGPRQALLDAVDIALHHGATGVTYRDMLTPRLARAA
jgi:predicted deacetylase